MNLTKAVCAVALAFCAVAATPALAHSRVHFGFSFGGPIWYPAPYYYYPPPVYYYPPPIVVQQPPTYIEQPAPAAPAPQSKPQSSGSNDWYYCRDSQTYYPYVQSCPSPWQRVPPRPAGS